MRLIDADVLKQHIDKLPALPDGNFAGNHSALKALINMQPTIESSTNCSEIQNSSDCISRQAAIETVRKCAVKEVTPAYMLIDKAEAMTELMMLPSAQPEWNNHTVACLLAEVFDDACACNYNGIDEWLPEKCELLDACPNPVGVACWEQFLKHKAERITDE